MYEPILVVLMVFVAIAVLIYWQLQYNLSRKMLERWAVLNRYKLLSAKRQDWILFTPFSKVSKGQTIFRIEVQDHEGNFSAGYALCGSHNLGVWSDTVEVRWDMPPHKKAKHDFEKPKNGFKKKKREQPTLHRW